MAKFCPNAKSIEELFAGDEEKIKDVCRQLNCDRTELLINQSEIEILIDNAPIDNESKQSHREMINSLNK